jgi:hypothetical protein
MQLREIEPAEADGEPVAPNYGEEFCEQDYARVPSGTCPSAFPCGSATMLGYAGNTPLQQQRQPSGPRDGHT